MKYWNGTTRVQNAHLTEPTDRFKVLDQDYRNLQNQMESMKTHHASMHTRLVYAESVNAQSDTQLLDKIRKEKVDGFEKSIGMFNFLLVVIQKRSSWDAGSITNKINEHSADVIDTFFPDQDRKMRNDRFGRLVRIMQNFMSSAMDW